MWTRLAARAPQKEMTDTHLETDLNLYVNSLPAMEKRLQEIKEHQGTDQIRRGTVMKDGQTSICWTGDAVSMHRFLES